MYKLKKSRIHVCVLYISGYNCAVVDICTVSICICRQLSFAWSGEFGGKHRHKKTTDLYHLCAGRPHWFACLSVSSVNICREWGHIEVAFRYVTKLESHALREHLCNLFQCPMVTISHMSTHPEAMRLHTYIYCLLLQMDKRCHWIIKVVAVYETTMLNAIRYDVACSTMHYCTLHIF